MPLRYPGEELLRAKQWQQEQKRKRPQPAVAIATGVGKRLERKYKSTSEQQITERENLDRFARDLFSRNRPMRMGPGGVKTPISVNEQVDLYKTILRDGKVPPDITFEPVTRAATSTTGAVKETAGERGKRNRLIGELRDSFWTDTKGNKHPILTSEAATRRVRNEKMSPDAPDLAAEIQKYPSEMELEMSIVPRTDIPLTKGEKFWRGKTGEKELYQKKYLEASQVLVNLVNRWKKGERFQQGTQQREPTPGRMGPATSQQTAPTPPPPVTPTRPTAPVTPTAPATPVAPTGAPGVMSARDREALTWARANPENPMAKEIIDSLKQRGLMR